MNSGYRDSDKFGSTDSDIWLQCLWSTKSTPHHLLIRAHLTVRSATVRTRFIKIDVMEVVENNIRMMMLSNCPSLIFECDSVNRHGCWFQTNQMMHSLLCTFKVMYWLIASLSYILPWHSGHPLLTYILFRFCFCLQNLVWMWNVSAKQANSVARG